MLHRKTLEKQDISPDVMFAFILAVEAFVEFLRLLFGVASFANK